MRTIVRTGWCGQPCARGQGLGAGDCARARRTVVVRVHNEPRPADPARLTAEVRARPGSAGGGRARRRGTHRGHRRGDRSWFTSCRPWLLRADHLPSRPRLEDLPSVPSHRPAARRRHQALTSMILYPIGRGASLLDVKGSLAWVARHCLGVRAVATGPGVPPARSVTGPTTARVAGTRIRQPMASTVTSVSPTLGSTSTSMAPAPPATKTWYAHPGAMNGRSSPYVVHVVRAVRHRVAPAVLGQLSGRAGARGPAHPVAAHPRLLRPAPGHPVLRRSTTASRLTLDRDKGPAAPIRGEASAAAVGWQPGVGEPARPPEAAP